MKKTLVGEGKAKQLLRSEDPEKMILRYKDNLTAFNNEKKAEIKGKGKLNNEISAKIFQYITSYGIRNHFIEKLSCEEQLVQKLRMVPLEVVVRNVCAGSLVSRFGLCEGEELAHPIVEFYWKNDSLEDPFVNTDHIAAFKLADNLQIREMKEVSLKVNGYLRKYLDSCDLILVDFKLEFGEDENANLVLGDEISPDTCRLWDKKSGEKLDKDRFRQDLGDVVESYKEVYRRIGGEAHV